MEMVDSLDELKSSRPVYGKDFPIFDMLDVNVASTLNKIIQISPFSRKRSVSRNRKDQKEVADIGIVMNQSEEEHQVGFVGPGSVTSMRLLEKRGKMARQHWEILSNPESWVHC